MKVLLKSPGWGGGGGGGLPYKSDGDARWKIKIRPLRETNVDLLQFQLAPKEDFCVVSVTACFVNFTMHSPKQYLNGCDMAPVSGAFSIFATSACDSWSH